MSTTQLSVQNTLIEAWRSRRVWWFTATARTRARFARTLLGSFWLGLSNLISIAVLAVVYARVFRIPDFDTYVVQLGLGIVIWNSISAAIGAAPSLFEHNRMHLLNTNLNPIFYTLEEWAFQVQTFWQSFLLVLLCLSAYQHNLLLHLFSSGWLPLLNLMLFLYWLPVLICILGARYRDIYQLVPIALQLVFLLSPILYPKSSLGSMGWIATINPLYAYLGSVRDSLTLGTIAWVPALVLLTANLLGVGLAAHLITRERRNLPFLI